MLSLSDLLSVPLSESFSFTSWTLNWWAELGLRLALEINWGLSVPWYMLGVSDRESCVKLEGAIRGTVVYELLLM